MLTELSSYDPHCPHPLTHTLHAHSHLFHSSIHSTSTHQAPIPAGVEAQENDMVPAWVCPVKWASPYRGTRAMAEGSTEENEETLSKLGPEE